MQDLIRGIKKITATDEPKQTVVKETVVSGGNTNIAPLLERAFMFLEDGDWNSADEYCEKVLDLDPKCAKAYLGKLMAELEVNVEDALCNCDDPFDDYDNYAKVMRFADNTLKEKLEKDIEHILTRNENDRLKGVYAKATQQMNTATTEGDYKVAATTFNSISDYKDSKELSEKCLEKAEIARKAEILSNGKRKMTGEIISNYESAIKMFASISGWKDADEMISVCQKKIEEIKAQEEAKRLENERQEQLAKEEAERIAKRNKKIAMIATPIVCVIIAFSIIWTNVIQPNMKYNEALALMQDKKYEEAIAAFEALNGYKESSKKIEECNTAIIDGKYNDAIALMDAGNVVEAYDALIALGGYKDSAVHLEEILVPYLNSVNIGDYVYYGNYEQDNNAENGKEPIEWQIVDKKEGRVLLISKYILDAQVFDKSFPQIDSETDYYKDISYTKYKMVNPPITNPFPDINWENCSLNQWLNKDFVNVAFTDESVIRKNKKNTI